eukprot:21208_1
MLDTVVEAVCQVSNVGYVTAVILSMVFGLLWYGPIMGEVWYDAQGIDVTDTSVKAKLEEQGKKGQVATLTVYVIMSLVVSYLAGQTECENMTDACWLGGLFWVGFAVPIGVVKYVHNPHGNKVALLLDLSYQLMYFIAQAVCVVYFKSWNWCNKDAETIDDVTTDEVSNSRGNVQLLI